MLIEAVLGVALAARIEGAASAAGTLNHGSSVSSVVDAQQDPAAGKQSDKNAKKKQAPGAKPKKPKKPKTDTPAPDENVDETVAPPPAKGGFQTEWKQHPGFRIGTAFRADFEGQFQEDVHASYAGSEIKAGLKNFDLHRNRVGIKGNLFKHVQYEVKRELTEKEIDASTLEKCAIDPTVKGCVPKSQWKDVYVNITYLKRAQLQVGKFKIPFGMDELTGVTHNDFVYRSLGAVHLAPARDIGGMVHGQFFKKSLEYSTGMFIHDGENAHTRKVKGGDLTFAGRVTVSPFRQAGPLRSGLELGTAVAISSLSDDSYRPNGLTARTVMTQDTFYSPVFVKGHRRRWEGDVDWTAGPVSARSEFTWQSDDRLQQGLGDETLPDTRGRAWYVSGTWVLTGEQKKRPVKPANDLFEGGFGAVELAGRYERLWFDSAGGTDVPTRANRAETIKTAGDRVLTLGVNWTLNRFVKLQLNGIREHIEDPARSPVPNSVQNFWSRVLRIQFVI